MTVKYHITENGPRVCTASERKCPIGGDHFYDLEKADVFYMDKMKMETFATYQPSKNRSLPPLTTVGVIEPMKNNSYCGAAVSMRSLGTRLKALQSFVGEEKYFELLNTKNKRDGTLVFHVTVLEPRETRQLRKNTETRNKIEKNNLPVVDFIYGGIGTATDTEGNETWFVVVNSPQADQWRESLGLPKKDFHVTLGFIGKDVHNVPKNTDTVKIP